MGLNLGRTAIVDVVSRAGCPLSTLPPPPQIPTRVQPQDEFELIIREKGLTDRLNLLDSVTLHAPVGLTAQSWAHNLDTDIRARVGAAKAREERALQVYLQEIRAANDATQAEVEAMTQEARVLMGRAREVVEVVDRVAPAGL